VIELAQGDFSAGQVTAVEPWLIPENGAQLIRNGLLDDGGAIYRRGSTVADASSTTNQRVPWVYSGRFAAGQRTLLADTGDFYVKAAGGGLTNLGGAGLSGPVAAAQIGTTLFIPGGTIYAGSRTVAPYATGTVTVTNGSAVMTGAGTLWLANVDAGMLLDVANDTTRYYVVQSVDSNTQITLTEAFGGTTGAGVLYVVSALTSPAGAKGRIASIYGTVANKLLTGEGRRMYFSAGPDPTTGLLRPYLFPATNFHEFPGDIIAIRGLRDRALVFTTAGLYLVSGMAYDIVDAVGNPQHRVERLDPSLEALSQAGLCEWNNALIVAARGGVFIVDGIGPAVKLSASIGPTLEALEATLRPGGMAVFHNHLMLPMVDTAGVAADIGYVCRLDRPVKTSGLGTVFPWSEISADGGLPCFTVAAVDGSTAAKLLSAHDLTLVDCSRFFTPAGSASDGDGTTQVMRLHTRSWPASQGLRGALVKFLRVWYELEDVGVNPTIAVSVVKTGSGNTSVVGTLTTSDGLRPVTLRVLKRATHFHYELVSAGEGLLWIRALMSKVRETGKSA
jgi:hypothetical protein